MVQNSIKEFREHLAEVQNMKGLTSEEKGKKFCIVTWDNIGTQPALERSATV